MMGHIYVSEQAIDHVTTAELKALLVQRKDLWENGSFMPDSGYAAGDAYGEMAHWSQFVEGYISWIRANYDAPYTSGPAADHVAVLMGAASHGMVDQTFDILFWDKVDKVDGDAEELDTGIDAWLVADKNRKADDAVYLDTKVLSQIFQDSFSHQVSAQTINDGMETAMQGQRAVELVLAPGDKFAELMPWGRDHYLDNEAAGSYPFSAPLIARYWENIYRRLHGDYSLDGLVLGVHPRPFERLSIDSSSLDSYVTLFVGHGIDPASITADNVRIEDADAKVIATQIRVRGDKWAGTIQLKPEQDWAYKTRYTLILDELVTLNGKTLSTPYRYDFETQCEPGDSSCDPPQPGDPSLPMGCSSSARAPTSMWPLAGLLLVVAVVSLRRRPLAVASLLGVLLWSGSLDAAPKTASLSWSRLEGAQDCIGTHQLAAKVESMAGRAILVSAAQAELSVEGRVQPAGGWRALIVISDRQGKVLGERELKEPGASCRKLDDRVALAIVLMIDPDATLGPHKPKWDKPKSDKPKVIIKEKPVYVPVVVQPPPVEPEEPWRVAVEVGPVFGIGLLPNVGIGLQAGVSIEPPWFWAVEGSAAAYLPREESLGGASGDFQLAYVELGICPLSHRFSAFLSLSVCAGVQLGRLWADGTDQNGDWEQHQFVANLGSRVRLSMRIYGPATVGVGFSGVVALLRDSFEIVDQSGNPQELYRLSPVAALPEVSLGLRFP